MVKHSLGQHTYKFSFSLIHHPFIILISILLTDSGGDKIHRFKKYVSLIEILLNTISEKQKKLSELLATWDSISAKGCWMLPTVLYSRDRSYRKMYSWMYILKIGLKELKKLPFNLCISQRLFYVGILYIYLYLLTHRQPLVYRLSRSP